MYFFCDFSILSCLFVSGFLYGCYCKYTYIYRNFGINWFVPFGLIVCFTLGAAWTSRNYIKRKYLYENFYIAFYGLTCSIISAIFLITKYIDIAFYFIFMAVVVIYLPCYNYISLRCDSRGLRPARIAFGNTTYFAGLTLGFSIFNVVEPKQCAWALFGISLFAIICIGVNEVLQQYNIHNYKSSLDLVYNFLNEEKLIFVPTKSIMNLFLGRDDYCYKRNIQWMVVLFASIITIERYYFYSWTLLSVMYRSTIGYTHTNYLYLPYLLYTSGCAFGSILMLHYKPKYVYLMFGLIKVTIAAAVLSLYNDDFPKDCFILLCLYYISMGVYSSLGIQMLVESSPFLYTELFLSVLYSLEILLVELSKIEAGVEIESNWKQLLILSLIGIFLTTCSILLVQFFLMESVGLVEIRNRLLGIYRLPVKSYDNKLFRKIFFLQMEIPANDSKVVLENHLTFHQNSPEGEAKIKF